ncbi:MAG: putative ABC transporter permease, partial [Clostridia bacterium]|nr:putative ABC transporter permease [Clostridia bacterium]
KLFNRRWWDYTGWPLNINGRICIISVVAFGLATVALVKYIGPATISFINTLDPVMVQASSMVIALVMLIDTVYSVRHMNTDKLWFVEKQEEFIENNRIMNRIRETFKR